MDEAGIEADFDVITYRPEYSTFKNMAAFIEFLEQQSGNEHGMCKVIPPMEWNMTSKKAEGNFPIPTAVIQNVYGASQGAYLMSYDEETVKTMTYSEFSKTATSFEAKFASENETAAETENSYWQYIKGRKTRMDKPIYGIDNPISLFPESCDVWNMNKLSQNDSLIHSITDETLDGILTPYVYIGMRNTTFAWHVEDSYLLSVSFLHHGKQKTWYCIPHAEREKFEQYVKSATAKFECEYLIRHKIVVVPPSVLKRLGIKFGRVVQNKGEIVLTFSGGYHSGFNNGLNIAEAVNIGSNTWLENYPLFKSCNCEYSKSQMAIHQILESVYNDHTKDLTLSSSEGQPTWYCHDCKVHFTMQKNLNAHNERFHEPLLKHFECQICGQQCSTRSNLLNHHTKFHSSQPVPNFDECIKYTRNTRLVQSKRRDKLSKPKIQRPQKKCPHCDTTASGTYNLERHIRRYH